MHEFESPGFLHYSVRYNTDDFAFDCQLRDAEQVPSALQYLFPPEREDFITMKSEHDGDFIQIFFDDKKQITYLSSWFRIKYEYVHIPEISDVKKERFVFEKCYQGRFIFRGNRSQGIVEILLGEAAVGAQFFQYAANIAFGVREGKVRSLLFFGVEFIDHDPESGGGA